MTLRHRIAAVAGLAVAITVIVAAVAIYLGVSAQLHGQIDDALRARATELANSTDPDHDNDNVCAPGTSAEPRRLPLPRSDRDDTRFGGAEGYVQIVCPGGRVVHSSVGAPSLPVDASTRAVARTGQGQTLTSIRVGPTHLRLFTRGLGSGRGVIQVSRPLTEVDHALRNILVVLAVVAAAGIALAAALGALVAKAALAPVERFTRRTEEIASRPVAADRIAADGDDEIARLARSFNATLDALERSMEAQRHLVADASHELRTPMASLRANIQTLADFERLPEDERASLRADLLEELDELTALVSDVVELARGSKPGRALDDVRLDRIVSSLVERAERRGGAAASFRTDLEETVVRAEPDRVNRAVSNLIGNAVKWSPPGGVVELTLRDGTLSVRDHGPGFSPADLPHVFERFYRADEARGLHGSGLGLAIVRQAAEAHGGFAEAANAPDGGALLRVRFAP